MYESESEEHSESEFYYPEDTISGDEAAFNATDENQKSEAPALQNSQEETDNFVCGQKSANTVKKTRSDINIFDLASIGKRTVIESLPARELDHLLWKPFMNA